MPPMDFQSLADGIVDVAESCIGESVTYRPKAGGSYSIRGIFSDQFQQVDPDTEQIVASNHPVVDFRVKDLRSKPKKNDIVIIRKIKYRIVDAQEDGTAAVSCLLHKVGCE